MENKKWKKRSWRKYSAKQQPNWPDSKKYEKILKELSILPALVFAGETRSLKQELGKVAMGDAFVLQAGDCAEEFSRCSGTSIHSLVKVILQMSIVLAFAGEKSVVKIGRLAGQYAKPRSSDVEIINGKTIQSYRGDMVNSSKPDKNSRIPNPNRILEGYFRAAATLNLVRAFTSGGYASLDMVEDWHREFNEYFSSKLEYKKLLERIKKSINFSKAVGIDIDSPKANKINLYTSHEALLLGYEEAMTRIDTTTGKWYDTSAHMLWIGNRTRQLNGAHVEFLRGVGNPVGVKVGPKFNVDDIKKIVQKLNPNNELGKISLITRFGAKKIEKLLPPLLKEFKKEGLNIVWICDPMHGNTYLDNFGDKRRNFNDILEEIRKFFYIHKSEKTIPGGVHLELTGDKVRECIGGENDILRVENLKINYQTTCDPRLNVNQSLELAFEIANILNELIVE